MIPQVISFFQPRQIPVEFRDLPGHTVDRSLFDSLSYQGVTTRGFFECSPAQLLQAAAVHFQGRYRTSPSLQWLNACHEVLPSLQLGPGQDRYLRLNSSETGEFQTKSTEVIAVGLGLALSRQLFQIRYQDVSTIEGTKKRCDFSFQKNSLGYVLETRGRKRHEQIKPAIDEVFDKKANHSGAKYGFVSHLPREGQASSVIVVDPPSDARPLEQWDQVARLLRYYSSAARLSGFWRLSDLLNVRANALSETRDLRQLSGRPLEFGNVEKLGYPIEIRSRNYVAEFFVPRMAGTEGLFAYRGMLFVVGLAPELFRLLQAQDFDRLLGFRLPDYSEVQGDIAANVNDDGTVMAAVPARMLGDIVNR